MHTIQEPAPAIPVKPVPEVHPPGTERECLKKAEDRKFPNGLHQTHQQSCHQGDDKSPVFVCFYAQGYHCKGGEH